jgi:hypothetical protein
VWHFCSECCPSTTPTTALHLITLRGLSTNQTPELTHLFAISLEVSQTHKSQVPLFCFPFPDNLRPRVLADCVHDRECVDRILRCLAVVPSLSPE